MCAAVHLLLDLSPALHLLLQGPIPVRVVFQDGIAVQSTFLAADPVSALQVWTAFQNAYCVVAAIHSQFVQTATSLRWKSFLQHRT